MSVSLFIENKDASILVIVFLNDGFNKRLCVQLLLCLGMPLTLNHNTCNRI